MPRNNNNSGKQKQNKLNNDNSYSYYNSWSEYGKQNIQNTASRRYDHNSYQQGYKSLQTGEERFQQELKRDGLEIKLINGDGSCMYHSIADQLEQVYQGEQYNYKSVKLKILKHIGKNADIYAKFVENNDLKRYLQYKIQEGAWGDIVELKAAARIYKVNVQVYSTTDPSWELKLFNEDDAKTILLSYHGNMHYNSLRIKKGKQREILPNPEQQLKERRLQKFQNELRREQLQVVEVLGDGNCLFPAVTYQLQQLKIITHTIEDEVVKSYVLNHMLLFNNPKYISKVKGDFDGSKVELEVVAELFKVNICVFCIDQAPYKIESPVKSNQDILLSYHDDGRFNCLEKQKPPNQSQYQDDTQKQKASSLEFQSLVPQTSIVYQQQKNSCQLSSEEQQPAIKNKQEQKNQEEGFAKFCRELQSQSLRIQPWPGDGDRLIYCIFDQLQQVYPGQANLDYSSVQNKIQKQVNEVKQKYKFSDNEIQGPRDFGGIDELAAAATVFKVQVQVYYHGYLVPWRHGNYQQPTIYLSCHNGNIYYSLRKIQRFSSHRSVQQIQTPMQQKAEQRLTVYSNQLQVPEEQEMSRSPACNNFETSIQQFQTCLLKKQIEKRTFPGKIGSGFLHSIADQLQIIEDKWQSISHETVMDRISTYINKNYTEIVDLLDCRIQEYNLMYKVIRRQDLDIVSRTFEVNVVLYMYNCTYPICRICNFPEKPETIFLQYNGSRFISLRRINKDIESGNQEPTEDMLID